MQANRAGGPGGRARISLGYHLALVSPVGVEGWSEAQLLKRMERIVEVIPAFGFYVQRAVGGRRLSYAFWRQLADTPGVMAVKVAPFDRYETLEVIRAVASSERRDKVALYTGNDDYIINDLMTEFRFKVGDRRVRLRFVGGLLGQFAIWTKFSVSLLNRIQNFGIQVPPVHRGNYWARLPSSPTRIPPSSTLRTDSGAQSWEFKRCSGVRVSCETDSPLTPTRSCRLPNRLALTGFSRSILTCILKMIRSSRNT